MKKQETADQTLDRLCRLFKAFDEDYSDDDKTTDAFLDAVREVAVTRKTRTRRK